MPKKKKQPLDELGDFAIGTAKTGVVFGVAGAVGSHSPVNVTGGLSTAAGFMPMMGTVVGGGAVLKQLKKKKGGY